MKERSQLLFVLGLQGSPRDKGNTSILLGTFLTEAKRLGAHIYNLDVPTKNISPCQECGTCRCKKKGKKWDIPDPSGKSVAFMRKIRNDIEEIVDSLIWSKCVWKDSPFET